MVVGNILSGATSAVVLGLYLCEKLAGDAAREAVQKQMDNPYYQPMEEME